MVKLYRSKRGTWLVPIPKAVAEAKGFKDKQEMDWVIDNVGQLILKPKSGP